MGLSFAASVGMRFKQSLVALLELLPTSQPRIPTIGLASGAVLLLFLAYSMVAVGQQLTRNPSTP